MKPDVKKKFLAAYDQYADPLFRHCYFRIYDREMAKDLVQEAFFRTWSCLIKNEEIKNIRAFLYRVLQNLIIDAVRKKKPLSLDQLLDEGFEPADKAAPDLIQRLAAKEVGQKLALLAEPYRSAVLMRFIDELSPKEIAKVLGLSENLVSVRIHRGVNRLKQLLEALEEKTKQF